MILKHLKMQQEFVMEICIQNIFVRSGCGKDR